MIWRYQWVKQDWMLHFRNRTQTPQGPRYLPISVMILSVSLHWKCLFNDNFIVLQHQNVYHWNTFPCNIGPIIFIQHLWPCLYLLQYFDIALSNGWAPQKYTLWCGSHLLPDILLIASNYIFLGWDTWLCIEHISLRLRLLSTSTSGNICGRRYLQSNFAEMKYCIFIQISLKLGIRLAISDPCLMPLVLVQWMCGGGGVMG